MSVFGVKASWDDTACAFDVVDVDVGMGVLTSSIYGICRSISLRMPLNRIGSTRRYVDTASSPGLLSVIPTSSARNCVPRD